MKKVFLSVGVILLFVLYGIHQRTEGDEVHVVAPNNNSNSSIPNSSGNSSSSSSNNQPSVTSAPVNGDNSMGMHNGSGMMNSGQYKDGTYTGDAVNFFYGTMQVQAVISGGKITDVQFLQYPNDRGTSIMINQQAMPYLKQEAIQAQSANVDIVSGATDSSQSFQQSLGSALAQAH